MVILETTGAVGGSATVKSDDSLLWVLSDRSQTVVFILKVPVACGIQDFVAETSTPGPPDTGTTEPMLTGAAQVVPSEFLLL